MKRAALLSTIALAASLAAPSVARGQPVVQPLPPPEASELNAALRRLAANSRNLDALLDAGYASLKLDDVEAAIGFFGRAQELAPDNYRVKAGLAAAFMRSQRPVEALEMFEEAERAGAPTLSLAADRGLAYDMVGDNAAAQREYARAIAGPDGSRVRLQMALSLAIAGDRQGFERALYPLLERREPAAYRTRAFALAILGEEDEAVAITEAVMPQDMAARIAPYLRYMRRLTPAQQAAAANLGIFPRAAQIGRDDPRIASYRATSAAVRSADAGLAPTGTPLGARNDEQSRDGDARRRPGQGNAGSRGTERARNNARRQRASVSDPLQRTQPAAPVQVVRTERADDTRQQVSEPVAAPPPPPPPSPPPPPPPPPPVVVAKLEEPVRASELPSVAAPRPGFDLNRTEADPLAAASQPVVQDVPSSVADAFAGFSLPAGERTARAAENAVDITTIEPPREVEQKPPPPPPPPRHPSRHWVQVATGKDLPALKFDWRRISRKAPELLGDFEPHTTPWGVSNRLLAGPYSSAKAARDAVTALKAADVDSFTFTSDDGQEITPLK